MAASKRVGFAVVGLGHIAERAILPAFRHSKKSRLVALVSGDEAKAKRLARQFGAEWVVALRRAEPRAVNAEGLCGPVGPTCAPASCLLPAA